MGDRCLTQLGKAVDSRKVYPLSFCDNTSQSSWCFAGMTAVVRRERTRLFEAPVTNLKISRNEGCVGLMLELVEVVAEVKIWQSRYWPSQLRPEMPCNYSVMGKECVGC